MEDRPMPAMTIEHIALEDLAEIISGLVKQGLTFKATPEGSTSWRITLLGGY
jgi:hypothetical protein